jgi:hypothetical protein
VKVGEGAFRLRPRDSSTAPASRRRGGPGAHRRAGGSRPLAPGAVTSSAHRPARPSPTPHPVHVLRQILEASRVRPRFRCAHSDRVGPAVRPDPRPRQHRCAPRLQPGGRRSSGRARGVRGLRHPGRRPGRRPGSGLEGGRVDVGDQHAGRGGGRPRRWCRGRAGQRFGRGRRGSRLAPAASAGTARGPGRMRPGGGEASAAPLSLVGRLDRPPAPVSLLPISVLGSEWSRTTAALASWLDPAARQVVVRRLQEVLDELERRDPAGFARWLAAGADEVSDPATSVRGGRATGSDAA